MKNPLILTPQIEEGPPLTPKAVGNSGALIISEHSLPEADASVIERPNGKTVVNVQYFEEYLRFLELICWSDNVIIGTMPFGVFLPSDQVSDELLQSSSKYATHTGIAGLRKHAVNQLKAAGVLQERLLTPDKDMLRPDIYVRRLLNASPAYKKRVMGARARWAKRMPESDLLWYTVNHGIPCALTEFARRAGVMSHIPLVSHNVDIGAWDDLESHASQALIARLSGRLTDGARKEIEDLEALGVAIQMPPSPVAAWILREAHTKEDLVKVALQLRNDMKGVRQQLNDLQREMMDASNSVQSRIRHAREVRRVLAALDPKGPMDVKKEISSYSSIADSIKESILDNKDFTIKKVADVMMSKPIEYLIDRFRNRKYRVLFNLKHKFLSDSGYHGKVCSVLGHDLGDSCVEISMEYCGHAKLNSRNILGDR